MITVMKRKRNVMDYNPIQMIAGTGLVFMMISPNGRITKFNPVRHWIGGVVKSEHETVYLAQGKGWSIEKEFELNYDCPFHVKIPDAEGH